MKMLTTFLTNSFFRKRLETTPLSQANSILSKFIKLKVGKVEYQQTFSAYQIYLERVLQDNPEMDHNKITLLELTTKIYAFYRIPSQKLNKIHNYIAEQCLVYCKQAGPTNIVPLLSSIHRYNPKKSISIFKLNKDSIIKNIRSFSSSTLLNLIKFLKQAKIDDTIIRETTIEMLYKEISYLNETQLVILSSYLALGKKYINKDFLISFTKRVINLYRSNNLGDSYLFGILSNLSEIEMNLHTRSIYVDQLDPLYELAFPSLFTTINSIDDRNLNQLVSALRRSKYYCESMLEQLIEVTFRRQIMELSSQSKAASSMMKLATFMNIINTMAVFNYPRPEFKKYTLSVLKIVALHKQELLSPAHFSRLLWSLCILFDRREVSELYPLIERYLARPDPIPQHEAMNFYYCYLYLRTSFPKINDFRDKIHQSLTPFTLSTTTSTIQLQAFQTLKSIGVPCLLQYNLNNLICDIMVPQWRNLRNVIIEFHGFRHFFRNQKKLTGSNILKQKIIKNQMYQYYFISIDQWLITENKKQFILNFMEYIDEKEGKNVKKGSVEVVAKTATRVRSRPRSFR